MSRIKVRGTFVQFKCVWCGCLPHTEESYDECSAPDGDGHLFQMVKEEKEVEVAIPDSGQEYTDIRGERMSPEMWEKVMMYLKEKGLHYENPIER